MMKRTFSSSRPFFLAALLLAATVGVSSAAEFYLRAGTNQLTMPDNTVVTIWGFALDTDNNFATVDGTVTSPGPMLSVPATDTTLTIHLRNTLPEPVSLVIPGQIAAMDPQFFTDGQGRRRVRAFTSEAAANGGTATLHLGQLPAGDVRLPERIASGRADPDGALRRHSQGYRGRPGLHRGGV